MNDRESAGPPRLRRLFAPPVPPVDFNLLARYAADREECTAAERAEVERLAAGDPLIAVMAGLREPDVPPTSSPPSAAPPRSGPPPARALGWRELGVSAGVFVVSVVMHAAASRFAVPETLSTPDWWSAAAAERLLWGWRVGAGLAVLFVAVAIVRYVHLRLVVPVNPSWLRRIVGAVVRWLPRWQVVIPLTIALFLGYVTWSVNSAAREVRETRARLDGLFLSHQWVAYESPRLDPRAGRQPTEAEIREELQVLRAEGGFDALITFGSEGTLSAVPRIAKQELGFKAVIQGIAIPEWRDESGQPVDADAAFRRQLDSLLDNSGGTAPNDFVDAYCVGHNVSNRVPIEKLATWMAEVRRRSGKPVSTTGPLHFYLGPNNQAFREIGDFYLPDVNGRWSTGASPDQALSQLLQDLHRVGELTDKPVLLKMISYPSRGRDHTPEHQMEFFRNVSRSVVPPRGVYLSVFAGFDLPWKRAPEFDETEAHVGLFSVEKRVRVFGFELRWWKIQPKPALAVLRGGYLVQNRP